MYGFIQESVKNEIQKINRKEQTSILEGKEALHALKKFLLMPNRYQNREAIIPLKITSGFAGWRLKDELVMSLGLTLGDTIECDTNVVDSDVNQMLSDSLKEIDLFADGDNATWLVDNVTHKGSIIKAYVKFVSKKIRGITSDADAEVLKVALILVKDLDVTPPKFV